MLSTEALSKLVSLAQMVAESCGNLPQTQISTYHGPNDGKMKAEKLGIIVNSFREWMDVYMPDSHIWHTHPDYFSSKDTAHLLEMALTSTKEVPDAYPPDTHEKIQEIARWLGD